MARIWRLPRNRFDTVAEGKDDEQSDGMRDFWFKVDKKSINRIIQEEKRNMSRVLMITPVASLQ